jgi:nucleolar protein 16
VSPRDKNQTLSQNYKRLGLTARLNHISGGTEKTAASLQSAANARIKNDRFAVSGSGAAISEMEVERDPRTGFVLRIIDEAPRKPNPLNDPLNDLEESDPEEWEGFDNIPSIKTGAETETTAKLEDIASKGVRKAPKKQSQREQEWIERLVEKYGDDYGKMFRDIKLNPMQQSEGDIKRRVLRWKASRIA